MKVIIPVAGAGMKLRPHTHTQPKALVPIAGKPILAHIIDAMLEEGITNFVFIIGYLGEKIESYIRSSYPQIEAEFVIQEPREGLAHAIYIAKDKIIQEKEILIALGDTIVNMNIKELLTAPYSTLAVKKVDHPELFGVAEIDDNGFVKKLVEKPTIPKSNFALVGLYKIKNPKNLIDSITHIIKHQKKTQHEYHLTDALMVLIEQGEKMKTMVVNNWYDCGKKETLLEANAILLNQLGYNHVKKHDFPNTIIIPPVSIGPHCKISNSIIGPNVAIGDHTLLSYSIVKDSIIGSYSELEHIVLENSIVGSDSILKGLQQSLNSGDHTEIIFTK